MGPAYRHLAGGLNSEDGTGPFFRYDSKAKVIVYAWVND